MRRIVASAHRAGVAIELNSHFKISTDEMMLRAAAEIGAELAFGSDSHQPAECGDLSYHLETVEAAGLKLSDLRLFEIT